MDERDFAELISVFLKGSESTSALDAEENNEKASTITRQPQSSEAEIRKNIIEALAEKIRESQDKSAPQVKQIEQPQTTINPDEAETDGGPKESIIENEKDPTPTDAANETEPIDTSTSGKGYKTDTDTSKATDAGQDIGFNDDLITEEEVVTLLMGEDRDELSQLQNILDRFLKLDGITAAILVSRDGFMVEHMQKIEFDLDMVSAIVATGFGSLDRIGSELDRSDLQIAMLEYLNGPIILAPLVHGIVLVIVASQWATLGRVRWEIKKQTDELIANL